MIMADLIIQTTLQEQKIKGKGGEAEGCVVLLANWGKLHKLGVRSFGSQHRLNH